jgi:flagellar basal-body rod modification protein FlgD
MMSATLIGKEVKISSNTIEYNRQESAEIGYTLPSEANEITLKIYDEDGKLVRTVEDLEKSEGEHNYTWDFTDDDGDQVDDDSSFTYKIEATSSNDEDITVEQYQIGTIDAIRFTENGTAVVVNNTEYYLSDISEILTKTEIEDETS